MNRALLKTVFAASTALTAAVPVLAEAADDTRDETIIVTARRSEERLQDVPISITVVNQETLTKRNIVSTTDLGSYVPSLSINSNFGPEKSSFVIRGFTQEGKTSPSVGVYFADVVAPRSNGGTTSGNGAGVGSLFDLENVQVLKGPQGTLFGRNTTGGAILLVPTKPKDKVEGYVEGSLGNLDMHRVQAVINYPLSDTIRFRGGVDWNQRDGYVHNKSGVGPKDFDNTNYIAGRVSLVIDVTPELENYTIASFSRSNTHGDVPAIRACTDPQGNGPNPANAYLAFLLNPYACAQVARQKARGDGFWDVENNDPTASHLTKQWQVINTTTWQATDNLTVKNIVSYAEYREIADFSLFGDNLLIPPGLPGAGSLLTRTITLHNGFSGYSSQQSTMTEELQFQGEAAEGRLKWQAGAYFELSKPLGFQSGLTEIFTTCTNLETFACTPYQIPVPDGMGGFILVPIGSVSNSNVKDKFNNKGFYAQATYQLTDQFSLTGGFRYTIDKMSDLSQNTNIYSLTYAQCQNQILFPGVVATDQAQCAVSIKQKWHRPTWLIDLDYKPNGDMLLYVKWARGYRQGAINPNNLGLEVVGPEKVDTFEGGAKTTFSGAVSGYFNLAVFYNKFRDQQLAVNSVVAPAYTGKVSPAQPIVNAGKSRIWGVEADASVRLFEGFRIDAGYAYLNTKLLSFTPPPLPVYYSQLLPTADVGQSLALSPKNRITVSANYTLPLDESIGKASFGATFTHPDANRAVSPAASPNFYMLKKSDLLNFNIDWDSVGGLPMDIAFFMTNATNEKRFIYPVTALNTIGGEGGHLNQPRMYGMRVKFRID